MKIIQLPKNKFLKVLSVSLLGIIGLILWPFTVGGLIVFQVNKRIKLRRLRLGLIIVVSIAGILFGSVWTWALFSGSSPVTVTEKVAEENIILDPSPTESVSPNNRESDASPQGTTNSNPKVSTKSTPSSSSAPTYQVVKVVDGDTLDLSINGKTERIRLIGINTPETVDPRKPVECFGIEASNKAKATLSGKYVSLEKDASQGDRDKYGRLLGYIFLDDGTNFNKMMIQQGYAYEYTHGTPYRYQVEFKKAQQEAQVAKAGLWASDVCDGNLSPTPAPVNGHIFYLSTYYSAKYYYCDTDEGWKSLSTQYLKSYPSESALLKDYPNRTLHEACR